MEDYSGIEKRNWVLKLPAVKRASEEQKIMERQTHTLSAVAAGPIDSGPAQGDVTIRPKPYLSIRELSALTPWTEQAIRTMMAKGC